jgi:hypothetical protein
MMIIAGWPRDLVISGIYGFDPVNYFSAQKMLANHIPVVAGIYSTQFF